MTGGRSSARVRGGRRPGLSALVGLLVVACESTPPDDPDAADTRGQLAPRIREQDPASNRRMAARLAALRDPADFGGRLDTLDRPRPADLRGSLLYSVARAQLALRAGRTEAARRELAEVHETIERERTRVPEPFQRDVAELAGLIDLWASIRELCLEQSRACVYPPPAARPDDVRLEAAFRTYLARLREQPTDLMAAWLLDLAARLGGRLDSVPPRWRLPEPAVWAEEPFPVYRDVARELGVDLPGRAGGAVLEDLDGDGDLDIAASSLWLKDPIRLFENDAGRFVDRTVSAGLGGITGGLNLLQADYDNDGDVDLFVLRGGWQTEGQPNSLLRNEGGWSFTDVTEEAGVLTVSPTQTAGWADFDGDGWLDLFVGNESERRSNPPRIHPNELYRNRGDGTFEEMAAAAGVDAPGYTKSIAWGDYDGDGRPDLYLSRFQEPNLLLHNDGPTDGGGWRFSDRTAAAGVAEPIESFPAFFFDQDNDGREDLFVSGYRLRPVDVPGELVGLGERSAHPRLYHNRGGGRFEDRTADARLARTFYTMGSNVDDLDGDGWLDLYLGTGEPDFRALMPNRVLVQRAGGFREVTIPGGFGHLGKGHGVAIGDIDHDGDQDLYVVIGGAMEGDLGRNLLLVNPGHGNSWVSLDLVGQPANRSGIGARISLTVETPRGPRTVARTAGSGGSFGASSLRQEIGLGDASAIRELEIRWPGSGHVDRWADLAPRAFYRVREGQAPERFDPPAVTLPGADGER